ncbi:MAG: hypothetical protein ACOC0D_10715 [Spirochaeta sp.]
MLKPAKQNLIIALLILCTVTASVLMFALLIAKPTPMIGIQGLDEQQSTALIEYVSSESEGFGTQVEVLLQQDSQPRRSADIIFQPKNHSLISNPQDYVRLESEALGAIPRSISQTGVIGDRQIALPIALDHVELAFRRDLFASNGLPVQERVLQLADLEAVLNRLAEPRFYPLAVAGGNDEALLDLISVLVLSLGGVERYQTLVQLMESPTLPEDLLTIDLGNGWILNNTLQLLEQWEDQGILHPEWAAFSSSDVLEFAQRQLTAAVIMRLSTHRTWPVQVLRRWQSSPFPFADPAKAGTGLIVPTLVAAVPKNAARADEAAGIIPGFVGKGFQDSAVQSWRLAPVHSTAQALDRESGDLRFWAAASRELLPPLSHALSPEGAAELVAQLRVAL